MARRSTSNAMLSLNNLKRNTPATQKVVLIACGSFNPVTNMHLRMFELGRDALNRTGRYNVVGGIMSPVSDAYKKKDLAPANHRISMLRQALKSSDWIRLDTWESEQTQWLETEKVLAHHRNELESQHNANPRPAHSSKRRRRNNVNEDDVDNASPRILDREEEPAQLKLLCGADLLESFGTPGLWADRDIETIVGKYGLVCVTRAGSNPQKFIYESDVLTKYQNNIFIVTEWMTNEISSTKVRRALRRGESVKYLLPDSVIDYIREHQLYGAPDNKYINHLMPSPSNESLSPDEEEELTCSSSGFSSLYSFSSASRSSHSMDCSPIEQSTDSGSEAVPPSEKPVPCMTDFGTLMRRMKNYNLRIFRSSPTQL